VAARRRRRGDFAMFVNRVVAGVPRGPKGWTPTR